MSARSIALRDPTGRNSIDLQYGQRGISKVYCDLMAMSFQTVVCAALSAVSLVLCPFRGCSNP